MLCAPCLHNPQEMPWFFVFPRHPSKGIMKETEITIVDGKICIDGRIFEHHELREAKQYIKDLNASEALFDPNQNDPEELEKIIFRMAELTPEAVEEMPSYHLN